ncbi:hypothetical protein [Hydrogenophilus thermoluteolus]
MRRARDERAQLKGSAVPGAATRCGCSVQRDWRRWQARRHFRCTQ